ncbi:hypothetical protein LRE75_37705 [Streptomyces sp. 372A]|uniref:hypothetical protein n=1 Tax=Streptomyces sp. SAS_281 TaxID=3412744 RepID=UPI00403C9B06
MRVLQWVSGQASAARRAAGCVTVRASPGGPLPGSAGGNALPDAVLEPDGHLIRGLDRGAGLLQRGGIGPLLLLLSTAGHPVRARRTQASPRGAGHGDGVRAGTGTQALRTARRVNPGLQRPGGQAGPRVERKRPLAGQRAQHGLVVGVARVQGVQVGGHHQAPADGAGVVVDHGLHNLFVQARLVEPAGSGPP